MTTHQITSQCPMLKLYYKLIPTSRFMAWLDYIRLTQTRSTSQAGRQKEFRDPIRPAEDTNKLTKGLQERTQLIEWDDGET